MVKEVDSRRVGGVCDSQTTIQQLKPATDSGFVGAGPSKMHICVRVCVHSVSLGLPRVKRLLETALWVLYGGLS